MARIRTIKPEFWSDAKIGKLPPPARLLYIGTWNIADDDGILLWTPQYIKAQLFMYDQKITIRQIKRWMDNIASLNFITVYTDADGNSYGFIQHMRIHQRIDKPKPTTHPHILEAILKEKSTISSRHVDDDSATGGGKGREGEGEGNGKVVEGERKNDENPTTTTSKIIGDIFKSYESNIGKISPAISDRIKALIAEHPPDWIIDAIEKATRSEKRNLSYVEGILRGWKQEGKNNGSTGRNSKANIHPGANSSNPQGAGGDRSSKIKASLIEHGYL
jgi:DnaD/phage-associated family protein